MAIDVIGAGFPRTGTQSLQTALERLGFVKCYHMTETIEHPEHAPIWSAAADGKPVDWNALLAGYRATTDAPACLFYKQIYETFPNAKVVLSLRDAESWFASVQQTILSPAVMAMLNTFGIMDFANKIGFGDDPRLRERAYMIDRFNRHNEEVKRTIPAARLLVFQAKDGWAPLCKFLGVPVPQVPYPHDNARGSLPPDFSKGIETMSGDELRAMFIARTRQRLGRS